MAVVTPFHFPDEFTKLAKAEMVNNMMDWLPVSEAANAVIRTKRWQAGVESQ